MARGFIRLGLGAGPGRRDPGQEPPRVVRGEPRRDRRGGVPPGSTRTARPSSAATSPSTRRRPWSWSRTRSPSPSSGPRAELGCARSSSWRAAPAERVSSPGRTSRGSAPWSRRSSSCGGSRRNGPTTWRPSSTPRAPPARPKGVMLTPAQPHLHRGEGAGDPARRRRGPPHQLPAALAHRRAGRLAPALARQRRLRPLRGEPREAAREPARGAPAPLPRRAARVGEDPGRHAGRGRRGEPAAAPHRGLGEGRRASPAATPTRRAGRGPGATASPTASSSRRCAQRLGFDETRMLVVSAAPIAQGDARLLPEPGPARSWRSTA